MNVDVLDPMNSTATIMEMREPAEVPALEIEFAYDPDRIPTRPTCF